MALGKEREGYGWTAHAQFLLSFPPIRFLAAPGEEILEKDNVCVLSWPHYIPMATGNKLNEGVSTCGSQQKFSKTGKCGDAVIKEGELSGP